MLVHFTAEKVPCVPNRLTFYVSFSNVLDLNSNFRVSCSSLNFSHNQIFLLPISFPIESSFVFDNRLITFILTINEESQTS
jgi:hypothetical protein